MQFELCSLILFDVSEGMLNKVKGKVIMLVLFKIKFFFYYVVLLDMFFFENFFDVGMINLVSIFDF